ncbi:Hsp20/alpha crystallin family protein [Hymenobacter sp. BT664]|uniref:Hsp20/alpha crystallin family protein n=1 Tax=Hymenobacter montanus TaxID=2771359 RepID=A0A927BGB8_9BACT|nr:Hsp20/alpha crystallin family protein [Hymenobacter montanus]MBD2769740.1 Hsp20/alpha crystallin family protein [Hymenobacter montanus]
MAIQKYQDSFGDMMPMSFSTMLDRFFQDSLASRGRVSAFSPQVDAYETEKGYQIEVALPGLKREDIKVDFQQGRLTISGERHFKNEQNERRYHVVESSYGSFQRSFQLPDTVEPRQIQANFEDGILRVMVPKNEEKTMRHQIQIQGGQANNQQAMSNGQISEHMGQQATDAQVQEGNGKNGQKGQNGRSNRSGQEAQREVQMAAR